jgi:hypothetical protein
VAVRNCRIGLLAGRVAAHGLLHARHRLYARVSGRFHRLILGLTHPEMHKVTCPKHFWRVPRHFSISTDTIDEIPNTSNIMFNLPNQKDVKC